MKKQTLITIPKNTLNVHLFPSYVSNGHWAIKKSKIKDAALFETETLAATYFKKDAIVQKKDNDAAIHRINNTIGEASLWSATRYLEESKGIQYRFFVNAVTGELVQFNRDYIATLGLDHSDAVLWSSGPGNAFRDSQEASDMTLLIMPVKFEAKELTVFQATLQKLENN